MAGKTRYKAMKITANTPANNKNAERNFPKRLRSLRHEKGMTQTDLAQKLHVSRTTITNWESGNRYPDSYYLFQLMMIFAVPIEYLYGISDRKYNINIPGQLEIDLTKLNAEGIYMMSEYYKLLINSEKYRNNEKNT